MPVELVLLSRVAYRGQEITGAGARGFLALLAGELHGGCGTNRLIDGLWPEVKPEHPAKALQIIASRVRARLGPDVILSTPTGYRLGLDEEQVDSSAVLRWASSAEQLARGGDPGQALEHADAGLALCDGAAGWDDADGDPLSALRAARAKTYRSLIRTRALALAKLGHHAEAFEPLGELVRRHPRDEELLTELLRCEAATAGAAAALERYDDYRRALRDDLGADPGPALQDIHRTLLRGPVRSGVRQEPNPLLGRDRDVTAVAGLLRTSRVTSIVGVGGLGKTRLAHAVAAGRPNVHVVALAGVTEDDDVAGEVASVLGLRGEGRLDRLVERIGPDALLVLDNCEHVIRGVADLVQALVSLSRDLRILTTSRAPLRLWSESVYQLPELDPDTMIELFGQRARATRPGVELPGKAVRELCGRLDGLPLAVELAAARVRVMSVTELTQRLDDRFDLLRSRIRDAPPRHHTLHAVIDWSWHLLDPEGQQAMRTLSIFPGGFSRYAATRLLGSAAILEHLVDQSLLRVTEDAGGTRLRMLESVREFSTAQRDEAGETPGVIDRFLAWARDFEADMSAVPAIRQEQDNLLQALRYGLDRADGATVASTAALLGALWVAESNFTRLVALAKDTGWTLSHFRPAAAFVEDTRTAAVLGALVAFVTPELNPLRFLTVLRRLPQAAPDTPIRATHVVLCAPDAKALNELAANDEPMVAAIANYVLSYMFEYANEPDKALRAAKLMLASLSDDDMLMIRALAYGRVGELSLRVDPGEPAFHHLSTAVSLVDELGWSTTRGRWALVQANIQRGAYDEAEQKLAEAAHDPDLERFEMCARAEIQLGRGDIEGGLRLWREAVARPGAITGLWRYELEAVAVVVHARHGRIDLLGEVVDSLPGAIDSTAPTVSVLEFPICGSLLLALAMADVERGAGTDAARMLALAARFGVLRGFQPAMSPEAVADIARRADRPAYEEAVSAYAGLDHHELRQAVRDQLGSRRNSTRAHP